MPPSPVISSSTDTNVFETGKYTTVLVKAEPAQTCTTYKKSNSLSVPPPKQLLIATPSEQEAGEFPVLMLLHGYLFYNSFYSQLIQHIASHGFIVVAPQVKLIIYLMCILLIHLLQFSSMLKNFIEL